NWPGIAVWASRSMANESGPPDTARPIRPPCGHSRSSAEAKRAASAALTASLTADGAAVPVILALQPPGGERGILLAELGESAAGALGVLQRDHRFGEVEQAVGRAGTARILGVVLEKVGRRRARVAAVEIGAAEQVAP